MEQWFWLSFVSAVFFACSITLDKITVSKYFKNPAHTLLLGGITIPIILVFFLLMFSVPAPSSLGSMLFMIFAMGGTFFFASMFYFKALAIDDSSNISAMLRLVPAIVLVLAFIFFNEKFEPVKYIGIMLLIIGAVGVSVKNISDLKGKSSSVIFIILSCFLYALTNVFAKYILASENYLTLIFYYHIGISLFCLSLLMISDFRNSLHGIIKNRSVQPVAAYFTATVFTIVGEFAFLTAIRQGFLSLVSALISVQAVFNILFAFILTIFVPHVLKEEISNDSIARKLAFISLLVLGAYIIS